MVYESGQLDPARHLTMRLVPIASKFIRHTASCVVRMVSKPSHFVLPNAPSGVVKLVSAEPVSVITYGQPYLCARQRNNKTPHPP